MSPPRLQESEIEHLLATIPFWHRKGKQISRLFEFPNFKEALDFVNRVAAAAEKAAHHPDITIHWNQVTLVLTTKSEKGLTQADFDLASAIDMLVLAP